jgi:hypothetical protein
MWKYILLFILGLIFIPIILVALGAAFLTMDSSMLDPTLWSVGTRKLCVAWVVCVLVCCGFTVVVR